MSKKKKLKVRVYEVPAIGPCNVIKMKKNLFVAVDSLVECLSHRKIGSISEKKIVKFAKKKCDSCKIKSKNCDADSQFIFENEDKIRFVLLEDAMKFIAKRAVKKAEKLVERTTSIGVIYCPK